MQDTVENVKTEEPHPFLSMPKEPWRVQVYENGKWIGALDPQGATAKKKLFMAMFEKDRAEQIAAEINEKPPYAGITAKAAKF